MQCPALLAVVPLPAMPSATWWVRIRKLAACVEAKLLPAHASLLLSSPANEVGNHGA